MYIVKPADKIPTIIGTNNESKNFMMFSTLISIFINYFLIRKINITS